MRPSLATTTLSLCLAGLLLSACGGTEDNTPRQTPDLSSDAGVQRELVIVSGLLGAALGQDEGEGSLTTSTAKAKSTSPCLSGGTVTVTESQRTETFAFFPGTSAAVAVERVEANQCQVNSAGFSSLMHGTAEFGENANGTLSFANFGSSGNHYITRYRGAQGFDFTTHMLGRLEERTSGGLEQSRLLMEMVIDSSQSPRTFLYFGNGQTPFSFDHNPATGADTLSGRFRYDSQRCTGTLLLSTPSGLVYSDDGDFPSSGKLEVTSETGTATYTFNGDTVSYVTSSGLSGTATLAELEQLDPGC